jgi:hypothetical protein
MRIALHKISDDRHALELIRESGARERVECETRSFLLHDLLHYAVESEARLAAGFWGELAHGKTLAQMNDRTGAEEAAARGMAFAAMSDELAAIEQVVGVLSGLTKGRNSAELVSGMRRYAENLGTSLPDWVSVELVDAVQERMRRLIGHWKATPYGGTMELQWELSAQAAGSR